jgi:hypothetical protein
LISPLAGCQGALASVGPVIGYVPGRGASYGWEVGGGQVFDVNASRPKLLLHFDGGMSWRRGGADPKLSADRLSYLVWEPVLYVVPVTAGVAWSRDGESMPMAGLWGGWPVTGACGTKCLLFSIVAGYRWSGTSEFYFTPKVNLLTGLNGGAD